MRKLSLLMLLCICMTSSMFGQFKIDSEGFAKTNNIAIDGVVGVSSITMPGVFTVSSKVRSIHYDSYSYPYPLALVCTKSNSWSYPFMNINNRDIVNFYIDNTGAVHATSNVIVISDSTCKENIAVLQPTMSKIRTLHGISFNYKGESIKSRSSMEELPQGATPEISQQIALEMNRKRIGLIAQEVEKVFPEVVRTSYDGTKGVMYGDLVCVLIEGMKELQDSLSTQVAGFNSRIASLEQQLSMFTSAGQQFAPQKDKSSQGNAALGKGQAELYQNTPNPFNRETEISYRLSGNAVSAFICIYNLNGQQLKKYALSPESYAGKIILSASEFTPGMYIYSLVINNRMIDSKRMTLTD